MIQLGLSTIKECIEKNSNLFFKGSLPQPKREKFPPKPFLYLAFGPMSLYSNLDLSKTVLRQDLWNTSLSVPYK